MANITQQMIAAGEAAMKAGASLAPSDLVSQIFTAMAAAMLPVQALTPVALFSLDEQPDLVDLAVTAFNDAARACPRWAECKNLTPARRKAILARLKIVKMKGWCQALEIARASQFLGGPIPSSGTHREWRLDISWFAKAENFAKIMDGSYPPGAPTTLANRPKGLESAALGLQQFIDGDVRH